jgi:hypothetical protein
MDWRCWGRTGFAAANAVCPVCPQSSPLLSVDHEKQIAHQKLSNEVGKSAKDGNRLRQGLAFECSQILLDGHGRLL